MKTMGVAEFKQRCLELLGSLPPEGLVITRHGKPMARVTAYERDSADLIGCLRDQLSVHGDLFTTGTDWDASAES